MKIKYNKEKDEQPTKNKSWLNPNKECFVFSIKYVDHCLYYGIATDDYSITMHSYKLFDIITSCIPPNWIVNIDQKKLSILPQKWQTAEFWNSYYDGERWAELIFEEEKQKICFSEFYEIEMKQSNKTASFIYAHTAQTLDENWFMCPNCYEGWESSSREIILICPKCKQTLYNSLYKPEKRELIVKLKDLSESNSLSGKLLKVCSISISEENGIFFQLNDQNNFYSLECNHFEIISPFFPLDWQIYLNEGLLIIGPSK